MTVRALAVLLAVPLLFACDDASTDGTGGSTDGVEGGVVYHSLNKLVMTTAEYSGLEVALVDEGKLLADANAAPIAAVALDTPANPSTGQTKFAFPGVDFTGASVGVAVRVADTRATPLWITTETSSIDAAALASMESSGGGFSSAVGFALSRDAFDGKVATLAGVAPDELLARGVIFGLVYDGISADGSGTPVTGATVAPSDASFTVIYPTGNFSGTQSTTGNQGVFLAIPSASSAAPKSVTFTVTPPAGQSLAWDSALPAIVRANAMFFIRLFAK